MEYHDPGPYKFSLTVWNDLARTYLEDERDEVEIVTIGLGTREFMDEVTLKLRPAEAKRLGEALLTAADRKYTPESHGFRQNPNDIPVVGLFDRKYNMETGENDCTCCTCGHKWSMHTLELIKACPNCGVLAEDRW